MSKSQKKGPAFLLKTFDMLEKQQFRQIIDWIADGTGFVVKSPTQLAQKVLPIYFKHSNMHSFIRQLNMYGFNKKRGSKTQNYYFHSLFRKGQRDMIGEMQRKAQKKGTNKQLTKEQVNQEVSIQVEQGSQQNKQNKNNQQPIVTENRRKQNDIEQSQIKKNIVQVTAMNKVLLLEQIYHLANIEANNLLVYHQKLQEDDLESSCENIVDFAVLERFRRVKNQYLKIHSMIWDKASSIAQSYQTEILKNNKTSLKEFKQTEINIDKKQESNRKSSIMQSEQFKDENNLKIQEAVLSENKRICSDQIKQKEES